jgi:hypothetical protein
LPNLAKYSKKESRKKPKSTRTINSQKGANPKISNLQNNTRQCARPEFAKASAKCGKKE